MGAQTHYLSLLYVSTGAGNGLKCDLCGARHSAAAGAVEEEKRATAPAPERLLTLQTTIYLTIYLLMFHFDGFYVHSLCHFKGEKGPTHGCLEVIYDYPDQITSPRPNHFSLYVLTTLILLKPFEPIGIIKPISQYNNI